MLAALTQTMGSSLNDRQEARFPKVPLVDRMRQDPRLSRTGFGVDFPALSHPQVAHALGKRGRNFAQNSSQIKLFWNEQEQKLVGAAYFSDAAEGAPNKTHGGALATVADNTLGWMAVRKLGFGCFTLNLNVNYRKFVPLNAICEIECWVERVEGRKIYLKCLLKNAYQFEATDYDSAAAGASAGPSAEEAATDPQPPATDEINVEATALFYKHSTAVGGFDECKKIFGVPNTKEGRAQLLRTLRAAARSQQQQEQQQMTTSSNNKPEASTSS